LNQIRISFCMPTRNRAGFIGQALDSILAQADDRIEIVIVDGASTDNTPAVVRSYQQKFKNVVYQRLERNGGVDRDMGRALKLARGEYCWLLTDDDVLKPGALKRLLREIDSGADVYLCNIMVCDASLRPIRDRFWLSRKVQDRFFDLHNREELIQYCQAANSIGALFSYWSCVVLRREAWAVKGFMEEFDGSAYALAASMLSLTKSRCRLKYIRDSLVFWRADNISFQNEGGLVKRFLLDLDGYRRLAEQCLPDDWEVKENFLRVMTREHPWYTIVNVTSFISEPEVWAGFRDKLLAYGYSPCLVAPCYALGRYKNLVSLAVALKRRIVKSRWLSRVWN
jgi:abequosyltransferase